MDRETNHIHSPSSNLDNTKKPEAPGIDQRLIETRSRISDLGFEIDARKAAVARAMGGAVFLLMLAAGAAFDLVTQNAALSIGLGVTRETLFRIALGCGLAGLVLLTYGIFRSRLRNQSSDAKLAELEDEYADLLDRKNASSQSDS